MIFSLTTHKKLSLKLDSKIKLMSRKVRLANR